MLLATTDMDMINNGLAPLSWHSCCTALQLLVQLPLLKEKEWSCQCLWRNILWCHYLHPSIFCCGISFKYQWLFAIFIKLSHSSSFNPFCFTKTLTISRFTNCIHVREELTTDCICRRFATRFWLFKLCFFHYTSSLPPVSIKQHLCDKEPWEVVCTGVNFTSGD